MNLTTFYPPYFVKRIAVMRFEAANPTAPWLTADAITALADLLKPDDVGYEFGSGRSTVWFANKVRYLHSMEHAPEWYERVRVKLGDAKLLDKIDYRLAAGSSQLAENDLLEESHPYVAHLAGMPEASLDFILVDGMARFTCFRLAIPRLKPGGVLILDNSNRFTPNHYPEGYTTIQYHRTEPRDQDWSQALAGISHWRGFNTTNSIWDTRFWIKPLK
jgi:predicted O-methyltransferase YrrM